MSQWAGLFRLVRYWFTTLFMNVSTTPFKTVLGLFVAATLLLTGCKKDPVEINPTGTAPDAIVNDWILQNMKDYYYWTDKLPANPDKSLTPDKFFGSLLYKFNATTNPEGDRFSFIRQSATELQALLSGESKTTGMDFDLLLRTQGATDVIGVVLYVLPGSPADKAGVKRNDIFYSVNGTSLTTTNYSQLLFGDVATLNFGFVTVQNGALVNSSATKSISPVVFQENPVYQDSVYTDGDRKIGYLVYNQFVPGPNGSTTAMYDNQVDAIFAKFKQQGINELVLDLRYNPGGSVASSAKLASLIVKGVAGQSKVPFVRTAWNPQITTALTNDPKYGTDFFYNYFETKANNVGSQISRLYVLTTDRTASASELIINGLRPFMPVNTIGSATAGKNVGSITLTDTKNKANPWGMQPITFRSYNKNNESNYFTGFAPTVSIDEPYGALYPLGDTRDALLASAISHMKGQTTGGRRGVMTKQISVGSSIARKAAGSNMFVDMPALEK